MYSIQTYLNKTQCCLEEEYFFRKEIVARVNVLVLPVFEALAALSYVIQIPISVSCTIVGSVIVLKKNDSLTHFIYGEFKNLILTTMKAFICFINIIVAPFLGLVSPATNIRWHIECGLGTEPERKQSSLVNCLQNGGLDKVAGMEKVKETLRMQVIAPLTDPESHKEYDLSIPNGIIFYGPPGCGKTYIAKQLAGEIVGCSFQEIKISDIGSTYLHETSIKINNVFNMLAGKGPAILFIDEIDTMLPSRTTIDNNRNEEIGEFLKHLSECASKQILVIAATNHLEKIDPAICRSGRFDTKIYIGPPDEDERVRLLKFYMDKRPKVIEEVNYTKIAQEIEEFSASDIQLLVKTAARYAHHSKRKIREKDLEDAIKAIKPKQVESII
jgi:ATP-dependent Zn protease